jgi:hypothetical protein
MMTWKNAEIPTKGNCAGTRWTYATQITDVMFQPAKPDESHWEKIRNLKSAAQVLIFLQENNIRDMAGVRRKYKPLITE